MRALVVVIALAGCKSSSKPAMPSGEYCSGIEKLPSAPVRSSSESPFMPSGGSPSK